MEYKWVVKNGGNEMGIEVLGHRETALGKKTETGKHYPDCWVGMHTCLEY